MKSSWPDQGRGQDHRHRGLRAAGDPDSRRGPGFRPFRFCFHTKCARINGRRSWRCVRSLPPHPW